MLLHNYNQKADYTFARQCVRFPTHTKLGRSTLRCKGCRLTLRVMWFDPQDAPGCRGCAPNYYPVISTCTKCPEPADARVKIGIYVLVIAITFIAAFLLIFVLTKRHGGTVGNGVFRYAYWSSARARVCWFVVLRRSTR